MARSFNRGSSQYLNVANAVVSSEPLTMACWGTLNSTSVNWSNHTLMAVMDGDAATTEGHAIGIARRADQTTWRVQAKTWQAGAVALAQSGADISGMSGFHHVAGVFAASDDREVFIDGISSASDATLKVADNLDSTQIGAYLSNSTITEPLGGEVAEAAIWSAVLTSGEIAALAAGASPLTIRPQSLVAYWPLIRTDQDWVGGYNLTPVNTPTIAAHAPKTILALYRPRGWVIPAAAGSESASVSPSISPSPSSSESPSLSPSSSESPSVSASISPSVSPSVSPSPSPGVTGETCWGHDTGVTESNVRDFNGNWTGTGEIENPGVNDTERLALESGEYMISEIVDTGLQTVALYQNQYQPGDDVNLDYRHGATPNACAVASWNDYSVPFVSLGYVQIRVTSTL